MQKHALQWARVALEAQGDDRVGALHGPPLRRRAQRLASNRDGPLWLPVPPSRGLPKRGTGERSEHLRSVVNGRPHRRLRPCVSGFVCLWGSPGSCTSLE
eukprot:scaffold91377_cov66-Phaeocystis_antarctica.AAC.2